MRFLIYFYIFFTIFDGVFRKWILPQLSNGLMVVKGIIAVIILFKGIKYWNKFTSWEISSILLGYISFILTLLFGHGNLGVAIYGCFPLLVGIPVCFIIGKALDNNDIMVIGRWFVYIAIINSILITIQFMLPVGHIINIYGGNPEGIEDRSVASLSGAFRPSGLFYHSTHNVSFCSLAFAFILYFYFVRRDVIKRNLLQLALLLELISIVLSSSRTNVFVHIGILSLFFLFAANAKKKKLFIKVVVFSLPLLLVLASTSILGSAFDNLGNRFESASQSQYQGSSTMEGTMNDIVYRVFTYHLDALIEPKTFTGEEPPFWGFGQGMGTQVGGQLLGVGKNTAGFSLGEFDGLRIMCESGLLIGWLIIFLRVGYAFRFLFKISLLRRKHLYLSLCILPSFLLMFYIITTWGNLFICNFAFIVGGLFFASLKNKYNYGY